MIRKLSTELINVIFAWALTIAGFIMMAGWWAIPEYHTTNNLIIAWGIWLWSRML